MKMKMTKMRKILIAALAVLAIAGCDDNSLKQGTVYERKYHPAYYYTTSQCVAYNSKGFCTSTLVLPHYQPESFEVCIQDPQKAKRKNCVTINHDEYEKITVGSGWPKEKS